MTAPRLLKGLRAAKSILHGWLERWQGCLRRVPDDADFDIVVTVAEMVANAAKCRPKAGRGEVLRPHLRGGALLR